MAHWGKWEKHSKVAAVVFTSIKEQHKGCVKEYENTQMKPQGSLVI